MITIDGARARILELARPLPAEAAALEAALGRTLAVPVTAAGPVPPFAASAMDGYALHAAPAGTVLGVAGESRAGAPAAARLEAGTAARISTGATIPAGTEAVARQEDVTADGNRIVLTADVAAGANIRRAGEDMAAGSTAIPAGTRVGPAELGVAAAAGHAVLSVTRRPQVRVLCTGDELREPGTRLAPGQIHNSNGPMLRALALEAGADAPTAALVPDEPRATERALAAALEAADLLIVSGGVSVGPHDHVKPSLERLGVAEVFWRVALQPGRPTWFGHRPGTLVLGLPGNPVSAAVTFALFARPLLRALLGGDPLPPAAYARLAGPARQAPDRTQALRVRLHHRPDGLPEATPTGAQGSHRTTSLLGADALAFIPPGDGELLAGSTVELELLPH